MATEELDIVISAKDKASKTIDKTTQSAKGFESQVEKTSKQMINFQKTLLKVGAAILAIKQGFDFAQQAAKFDQAEQAFANVATSFGANSKQMIADLKAMSGETLSTAEIMQSAGNAMILGIPADRLSKMMEIARASSRITGQSVQKSFEDIAIGVGRGSKMILDNLGILIDVDKANEEYARSINKTTKELTEAERKTAFLNATMKAGQSIIDRVGVTTLTTAEAFEKFKATMADLQIVAGKILISIGGALSAVFNTIGSGVTRALELVFKGIAKLNSLAQKIPFLSDNTRRQMQERQADLLNTANAWKEVSIEMAGNALQSVEVSKAIFREKEAIEGTREAALQREAEEKRIAAERLARSLAEEERKKQEAATSQLAGLGAAPQFMAGEQTEIARLMAGNEQKLLAMEDYNTRKIQLMIQAGATEQQLEQEISDGKKRLTEQETQVRLDSMQQSFGIAANLFQNLGSLQKKEGGKMFKAQKAMQIGQALMSTYTGATQALSSLPFPANIAAAASVIASGIAQVKSIQKQQPSGGSISAGGARQPSVQGGGLQSQQVPQRLEGQQQQTGQNVTINVQSLTGELTPEAQEMIFDTINNGADRNLSIDQVAIAPA